MKYVVNLSYTISSSVMSVMKYHSIKVFTITDSYPSTSFQDLQTLIIIKGSEIKSFKFIKDPFDTIKRFIEINLLLLAFLDPFKVRWTAFRNQDRKSIGSPEIEKRIGSLERVELMINTTFYKNQFQAIITFIYIKSLSFNPMQLTVIGGKFSTK